ncbi:AmpG family muropeptide MFS transporter [Catenovulum adriaticum]|uniref:MFS transporter n=1 Tax=Catenovulum adriaticum TaxID=2984846 RepID=A0ABY7AS82_9ALTE|nr:MFS transporter [Catenovulum sp. TS8]WAJ71126.1 MFS transporter [Catenovulum sp. TS8]
MDWFTPYKDKRVIALLFLGFSSGLPLLLVFSTLSFWLREAGIDRASIGMLSWVALAYAIKWLWSPLVDKLKIPFLDRMLGRRRSWMLLAQLLIAFSLFLMSVANPQQSLWLFSLLALAVAFSSATQDIVIDAFRIDSAPTELQAAMAATYLAGYRIAMITAGAGSLVIAAWFAPTELEFSNLAWQKTYQIMALLMLPGIITTLLCQEPNAAISQHTSTQTAHPFSQRVINAFWQPIADFFNRFGQTAFLLMALIAVYRLSDVVMGVMANPFYIDTGFTKVEIASISKVYGVIMTLVGAALGGIILKQKGTLFCLFLGGLLAAATNLLFVTLSIKGNDLTWLTLVISIDNLSAGIATAAFIAFLSGLTNKQFSATQYAIFSSSMLLLPKFVAGFSGFAVDAFDYTLFFIGTSLLGLPALLFIALLAKKKILTNQQVSND